MATDSERLRRLEKQMGLLVTHSVLSKFLQGGPLAIPESGMLLGGRRIVGGSPVAGQVVTWNADLQRYEPRDISDGEVFLTQAEIDALIAVHAAIDEVHHVKYIYRFWIPFALDTIPGSSFTP